MRRLIFVPIYFYLISGCSYNEQTPSPEQEMYYFTSVENEPALQSYLDKMSAPGGRTANLANTIDRKNIYKIIRPEKNIEIYSTRALDTPGKTVVMMVKDNEYYGYTVTVVPDSDWNGHHHQNFTGELIFESLAGNHWMTATLKEGKNVPLEELQKGRTNTCWSVIDVYYTGFYDENGDIVVTYIEFGDSYMECDPEPYGGGFPPPDGEDLSSGGGTGSGGTSGPDIGLLDINCPFGYERWNGECKQKCQDGWVRNSMGDCMPDPDDCNTTKEDIKKALPSTSDATAERIANYVNRYGKDFGIDRPEKLQHFIAQAAHETADFSSFTENLSYSTSQLLKTWPNRFSKTDNTKLDPDLYANNPEKLGNYVYARSSLGNTSTGDGFKYRGRGIFQLTGKSNYEAFNNFYRNKYDNTKSFVSNPELIATDLEIGVISALWYFENEVMKYLTINSSTTVKEVTLAVNGRTNGLQNRISKHTSLEENIDCK